MNGNEAHSLRAPNLTNAPSILNLASDQRILPTHLSMTHCAL